MHLIFLLPLDVSHLPSIIDIMLFDLFLFSFYSNIHMVANERQILLLHIVVFLFSAISSSNAEIGWSSILNMVIG